MVLVQLDNVSRMFGRFPALRKISLDFIAGRCYVLLGENGAGKSTLLRILAGLLEPTLGTARILSAGKPEKIASQRARIGYMSHAPMLYDELSAEENLRYFAGLYRTCSCLTPSEALLAEPRLLVGLDHDLVGEPLHRIEAVRQSRVVGCARGDGDGDKRRNRNDADNANDLARPLPF